MTLLRDLFTQDLKTLLLWLLKIKLPHSEGGAACVLQAVRLLHFAQYSNICKAGDSFVSTGTIYGEHYKSFAVTLRLGIECIFVDADAPEGL